MNHPDQQQELTAEAQETWGEIAPLVEQAWAEIFQTANKILGVHLKFGFEMFSDKISPSIEDILLSLKVVESLLDTLYNSGQLEYSESRMLMNARQQIWHIQSIAEALKNGSKEDYSAAIERMRTQAQI